MEEINKNQNDEYKKCNAYIFEKELKAIKIRALNETEDIKILFDAIGEMETAFSAKRLTLTKLSKTRKDGIKAEAIYRASKELTGTKFTTNVKRLKRENELLAEAKEPIAAFENSMSGNNLEDAAEALLDQIKEGLENGS